MKALVLGCGPAGLIAAHAIRNATGRTPAIISKPRKSEMFGAQYLHAPIPGLVAGAGTEGTLIRYVLLGNVDDYRTKVYGDLWQDRVSPEDLLGEHYAWDIRASYDELWRLYGQNVIGAELKNSGPALAEMVESSDLVVSSVPKPLICMKNHHFASQKVWAIGDAPERGQTCPVRVDPNTVVCNGDRWPSWYRASSVFNYTTAEWPDDSKPPISGVSEVLKPLSDNCDCWPNILHVGRYGKWEKGALSHHAYSDTINRLKAMGVTV